jgi:ParB family chromosome partitioning protein
MSSIHPNPNQPRQSFGDLSELVASIREKGVLEPLLVRSRENGYEIIAGERRWRACREIGIDRIPCIIKEADDRESLELALIENLQRKDLDPFEEADGLQSLAEKYNYTHAEIAQVIGKSRTSITESLSLKHMPGEVRDLCRQADILNKSLLLQVVRQADIDEMKKLVDRISKGSMTREQVRQEQSEEKKRRQRHSIYHVRGKGYRVSVRFSRPKVSKEEVIEALSETLDKLKI